MSKASTSKSVVVIGGTGGLGRAIAQYYADKGRYPGSLQALVEDGYLRRLPYDPFTQQQDWVEVPAEPEPDSQEPPGIYDVHSASDQQSLSGALYSEW